MDDRYFLPSELKERLQSLHPDSLALVVQRLCHLLTCAQRFTDGQLNEFMEGLAAEHEPMHPPDQLAAALEMIHQEEQRLRLSPEAGIMAIGRASGLNRALQILNSALADYDVDPHWAAMSAFVNLNGLVHSRHRTPELIRARNAMREYYDRRLHGSDPKPDTRESMTAKQAMVLNAIEELTQSKGYAPTYDEIAEHVGLDSKSTAYDHVQHLIKKGYAAKGDGPRTLTVVRQPG